MRFSTVADAASNAAAFAMLLMEKYSCPENIIDISDMGGITHRISCEKGNLSRKTILIIAKAAARKIISTAFFRLCIIRGWDYSPKELPQKAFSIKITKPKRKSAVSTGLLKNPLPCITTCTIAVTSIKFKKKECCYMNQEAKQWIDMAEML